MKDRRKKAKTIGISILNHQRLTSNTAITLIALIVTIIVLLIISAITINTILGDNGIIKKANDAKEKSNYSIAYEEIETKVLEAQMKNEGKTKLINIIEILKQDLVNQYKIYKTSQFIDEAISEEIKDINEIGDIEKIYVIHRGYEFEISKELKINSNKKLIEENKLNNSSSKKYLYKSGTNFENITGGYEKNIQENYNGVISGISEFIEYDSFIKLYSSGSGVTYGTGVTVNYKNYIKKENYQTLVIDFNAYSTDDYTRPLVEIEDTNNNKLYTFSINANEKKERQYLKIPLEDFTEDFKLEFKTSAVYSGLLELSIYNVFLTNETELEDIEKIEIPQQMEKCYLLQPSKEYEKYTGGYTKACTRYYNGNYTGTSNIQETNDCIILNAISNGSDYGTSCSYKTSTYIEKGNYTKLNIELEAISKDNYTRGIIYLVDVSGKNIYSNESLKPQQQLTRQTIQIDLSEINTDFRINLQTSSVLGGSVTIKVYNIYLSN